MKELEEHNKRRDAIIAKGKQNHGVADIELDRMPRAKFQDVFLDVAGYGAWAEGRLEKKSVECDKLRDEVERRDAVIAELIERLEQ